MMRRKILGRGAAIVCALVAGAASAGAGVASANPEAAEAPLWLRNAAISPDGATIAFTYRGDIYAVPTGGGRALQLTTDAAYDTKPFWSPDGSKIAFNSDRQGSMDVYVIPATGGTPRRLTTNSGKEELRGWAGNDTVLFSSSLQPDVRALQGGFQAQLYKVGVANPGRPEMVMSLPASALSVDANGRMLYQDRKGYEDVLRKHEHSSGTADIWLYDGTRFTQQTHSNVQNQNPVWASESEFYYLTEDGNGTMNVHRRSLGSTTSTQLTRFERHPVRSLSAAGNGTLAFSWNGELYTLAAGDSEPRKVDVEIVADKYVPEVEKSTGSYSARSVSVSPDGDEVAFIHRGDVYVTSVKYKTTKRITNTPEQERNVDFSPDGRTLVYDSERGGLWQLFTATIADKKEKNFTYATDIEEKLLYASKDSLPAFQPAFSPDGKKVAFLENRQELRIVDADGKHVKTALDGKFNYSYTDGDISFSWAPDSRWLLIDYIGVGGWNNTDIALVSADGKVVVDLTESGYTDGGARWALGGKAVLWSTDRNGYRSHGSWGSQRDVYAMFLDPEAYDRFRMTEEEAALADEAEKGDKKKDEDKEKKDEDKDKKKKVDPLEFDLPNAKYRTVRLTPGAGSYGDYLLNSDGTKFYYILSGDLWVKDIRKGDTRVLTKGAGYSRIEPDAKLENIYLSGFQIAKINLGSGSKETIDFVAERDYSPAKEREYIFDHMHKQVKDKFYDENLHGVDWDFYGSEYRRFLPHIDNGYDFAELLSEILGELNASHTGGRYYPSGTWRPTASLGAFFDPDYKGDGLKVTEVINRGPLAPKSASVKPGDIILAIDGTEIKAGQDYFPLLENKAGKRTRLTVKRKKGGKTEDINVKPVSQGAVTNLLYRRWVERNQAIVDSLSDGRIGYVHVEGMDSPSFREVFSELLGKYRNREAVVVDTRWNGGGWLHNDIAILLSGKEYVRFTPRGQYIGSEPFTQWTKPSAMLVNESNYSDAHGTPYTYKALGLGTLVGAPVPGTMTAVWWENQVDPSIVFGIPQVTSRSPDGTVLENTQLNPDIIIYNNPGDIIKGTDNQLVGAVKSLLEQLDQK